MIYRIMINALQILPYFAYLNVNAMPAATERSSKNLDSLEFPITEFKNPFRDSLNKRFDLEIGLKYEQDLFYATILEIGTPIQEITVLFDTGSSDLWVSSSDNPFCLPENGGSTYTNKTYEGQKIVPSIDCRLSGTYDANSSSSSKKLDIGRFYTNYSDGSFADGYWCQEKLVIDGNDISSLQFGVAEFASTPAGGVLGIGFQSLESVRGYDDAPQNFYPNFPQVLKKEGFIDTVSYSLYLNSNASSIMFGAVDQSKYTGNMYTFPMVNEYPDIVDKPATLATTLQGLGARNRDDCKQKTFSTTKMPALLDSGTSLINVPQQVLEEMASFVNATYSENDQVYILKCPPDDDGTEFIFDFGDLKISIPLSNLLLLPAQNGYCGFGVMPADDTFILGQAFLTSAYVVYDLDHYQISLAQLDQKSGSSQKRFDKISENGDIPSAITASAIPWSTSSPISVTSDLFSGSSLLCTVSAMPNITPSSTFTQPSTLSTLPLRNLSMTSHLILTKTSGIASSIITEPTSSTFVFSQPSTAASTDLSFLSNSQGYIISTSKQELPNTTGVPNTTFWSLTSSSFHSPNSINNMSRPETSVITTSYKQSAHVEPSHTTSASKEVITRNFQSVSSCSKLVCKDDVSIPIFSPSQHSLLVKTVTQFVPLTTTVTLNICKSDSYN